MQKSKKFESMFQELEEIVEKLENDDLELDNHVQLYKRGKELHKQCLAALDEAELTVKEV